MRLEKPSNNQDGTKQCPRDLHRKINTPGTTHPTGRGIPARLVGGSRLLRAAQDTGGSRLATDGLGNRRNSHARRETCDPITPSSDGYQLGDRLGFS